MPLSYCETPFHLSETKLHHACRLTIGSFNYHTGFFTKKKDLVNAMPTLPVEETPLGIVSDLDHCNTREKTLDSYTKVQRSVMPKLLQLGEALHQA